MTTHWMKAEPTVAFREAATPDEGPRARETGTRDAGVFQRVWRRCCEGTAAVRACIVNRQCWGRVWGGILDLAYVAWVARVPLVALLVALSPPVLSHAFLIFPETFAFVGVCLVVWLLCLRDDEVTSRRMVIVMAVLAAFMALLGTWHLKMLPPDQRAFEAPTSVLQGLKEFVATLKKKEISTNALPVASPNLNGRVERFIQTIKHECLFKFILFGQKHLDHIVDEWVAYYNTIRSHTERNHLPPIHAVPDEVPKFDRDQIVVRSHVGGLVKSFERRAA